jgi:hypothetical protein
VDGVSSKSLVASLSVRSASAALAVFVAAVIALVPTTACDTPQPDQTTYFDRTIFPILNTSCTRSPTGSGCHVADPKGNALGNLDVSTYAEINKRRDLLINYGPYGRPALLVKNIPPFQITLKSFDGQTEAITTDIKHTGGPVLDPTATAYLTLSQWMTNGATENNTGVPPPPTNRIACSDTVPPADPASGFDPNTDPTNADYQQFVSDVEPVFEKTCNAGNCHGSPGNEMYLTCGSSAAAKRWNYHSALQYLAQQANQAELVRRPLAPSQGGSFHEGGVIWQSTGDGDYQAVLNWATAAAPTFTNLVTTIQTNEPNFMFFVHRVQPMLVKKGCMMVQCHSAAMFHDYRLRGGTGGAFSLASSEKNYKLTLDQMALATDDVNASRLVQKNLYRKELDPSGGGIAHRGGPLFEDFGGNEASGTLCDAGGYDYDNDPLDKIPAYCMVREWHKRERADALAGKCEGGPCDVQPLSAIVYVKRPNPTGSDGPTDFDVYAPGAALHVLSATLDATGNVVPGADNDVTSGCGLSAATADIRRPASSWDGKKVAFAARSSASEPFSIYEMNADGSGCAKHAGIDAVTGTANGLLVHNMDPQYGPPDANGVQPILFVSTRGIDTKAPFAANFDYSGPQRQPADPTKPNPDVWVWEPDPGNAGQFRARQLTFQLDMERWPSFMNDGRIIFTAEKREPNFYQLALRRENLDGGDYHPLYSQRASIGFHEATQVIELSNKNFATIFSDQGWQHQGGVLGIFNRSLGIDYYSTTQDDYPIDPSVFDPTAASSVEQQFFLHSLSVVDGNGNLVTENGAPVGTVNPASYSGGGIYRSPSPLPNGKLLVSFSPATDPTSFDASTFGLYVLDPVAETKTQLVAPGGIVDAVAVYGKYNHGMFSSAADEPNGNTHIDPDPTHTDAQVFVLDMGILGSLLFQNTPTGRAVEGVDANGNDVGLDSFDVYEELPPDQGVTDFASGGANVAKDNFGQVYVRRRKLGSVNLYGDKSTYFSIPGGVPIVLHLPDTSISQQAGFPRWQKEEMSFYPGERSHQSFPANFFNGLCALCHGAVSGRGVDAAVNPDLLTQASQVEAEGKTGDNNLNVGPSQRGPIEGPPSGN